MRMRIVQFIVVVLIAALLTGCATMRRHPVVTGMIGGAAVGVTVALLTRRANCPGMYDGHPYSGTPPCPVEEIKGAHK